MAVQIKSGSEADKDETGKEYSDKQVKAAIAEPIVRRRYGCCCHVVRLAYKRRFLDLFEEAVVSSFHSFRCDRNIGQGR